MTAFLQLDSDRLEPGEINALARDMNISLTDMRDVTADLVKAPAEPGDRGALSVIGKLILDFVGTSAAAELIKVLGAYFNRDTSLEGKITFPDGTTVEVNAKNLSDSDFQNRLTSMINATRTE